MSAPEAKRREKNTLAGRRGIVVFGLIWFGNRRWGERRRLGRSWRPGLHSNGNLVWLLLARLFLAYRKYRYKIIWRIIAYSHLMLAINARKKAKSHKRQKREKLLSSVRTKQIQNKYQYSGSGMIDFESCSGF
jgi:hypothetical protein